LVSFGNITNPFGGPTVALPETALLPEIIPLLETALSQETVVSQEITTMCWKQSRFPYSAPAVNQFGSGVGI